MDQEQICANHPDRKAVSFCHHCGGYYCRECLREGPEFYYCGKPECLKALEAELRLPAPPGPEADETPEPAGAPPENPPENLVFLALYPNAHEADGVKARLESEGLECYPTEARCGLIDAPFITPVWLRVKEGDREKADQILRSLPSDGHPEPIDQTMNFDEFREAEAGQARLASAGIQSFLWDSLTSYDNRIHEAFVVLTRVSDVAKASNLLIVPETE